MKKPTPKRTDKPKQKRTFNDDSYSKTTQGYTVSDKEQERGETGYDKEGQFGIGMIKGK